MTITQGTRIGGTMSEAVDAVTGFLDEADRGDLLTQLEASELDNELLRESLSDLRLMLDDRGWETLGAFDSAYELPHASLVRASEIARTMTIANPLIRRGLALRAGYVWGGGVTINAQATGPDDKHPDWQDVNAVVQAWVDDPDVLKVFTSAAARQRNERALGTDGQVYVALFTSRLVGTVQPRVVPFRQVTDVIVNPDDATETWFYQRSEIPAGGGAPITVYHPDIDFRPRTQAKRIDSGTGKFTIDGHSLEGMHLEPGEIRWDAPIVHLKVNDLPEWKFGVGDAFSVIAWARGYKGFLEDWAKLVKALSRFAFRATSPTTGGAQAAAARIARTPTTAVAPDPRVAAVGGAAPVGQTYVGTPGQTLEAIPKTGATIDAESGKPLAGMIAAGLEVPVTMLLADPGITGARATAETLDTPTENMATIRRDMWADWHRQIIGYVIAQAVKAPQGALSGTITRDEWGREVVTLDGDTSTTLNIEWPDLTDTPLDVLMRAIAQADALDKLPPLLLVRLVLAAFKVRDADEWVAEVTGPDGEFAPPGVDPVRDDDPTVPEPPAPPVPDAGA